MNNKRGRRPAAPSAFHSREESTMHNELTKQDLKMMREELDYRRITLRPKLL